MLLNRNAYLIRERVAMLKLTDRYDILDPETGEELGFAREELTGFEQLLRLFAHKQMLPTKVVIRESAAEPGGMMRYGIPSYRLPREVLNAEIARLVNLGIRIECNAKVHSPVEALKEGFDAVFLAIGAHLGRRAYIPAGDTVRILDAVKVLHMTAEGEPPMLGRRVVVYGGRNTALDAARTAKRLGASEAIVVYRRTQEKMPAHESELKEALDEGIIMRWLSTIAWVNSGEVTIEKMKLDESGKPQPTGEFESLEADSVILALGQEVDLSIVEGRPRSTR